MALGVYGKHPTKGDFLGQGVPVALQAQLETWLDAILAEARTALGADWQAVWPAAPPVHFWLGEAIWGEAVAGLMAPSQDRVGRRFPLVFVATGPDTPPPPIIDAGQDWPRALAAHAAMVLARTDIDQPADLLAGAALPALTAEANPTALSEFWAVRPGPQAGALWQDVALADHRRAAANRSYWWTEGALPGPAPDMQMPAPEAAPAPDADADADITAPEQDVWSMAGVAADNEESPFSGTSPGLFAPPAPPVAVAAGPVVAAEAGQPAHRLQAPPRPAQVWAGSGLPGGSVIAWFFRGHAVND